MAKKSKIKPLEKSKWEDEKYINTADAIKTGRTEGIAIRTAKKYPNKKPMWRKSFWLQKDQKINEILDWLFFTVKDFFSKIWGKKIITQEDLDKSKEIIEDLREQLRKRENEYKELDYLHNSQRKDLNLARQVIRHVDSYEEILNKFEKRIAESVKKDKRIEEWIKNEVKKHRWIFGLDCEVKAKNVDVDPQTQIDLHIRTNYGEDRVIEVKSPNIPIFSNKPKRMNIHKELSEALSEVIEYLQRVQSYSQLRQRGTYRIDKPIGRILAGYNINDDEKRLLDEWNFNLGPVIKIITYNDLIANARKEIELIAFAGKALKKENTSK